jgi:hypothetical protein
MPEEESFAGVTTEVLLLLKLLLFSPVRSVLVLLDLLLSFSECAPTAAESILLLRWTTVEVLGWCLRLPVELAGELGGTGATLPTGEVRPSALPREGLRPRLGVNGALKPAVPVADVDLLGVGSQAVGGMNKKSRHDSSMIRLRPVARMSLWSNASMAASM